MHLSLKIKLDHISPQIWRKIEVSDQLTFQQLHNIIQVSMGWSGTHLFMFIVDGQPIEPESPYEENLGELNTKDIKLSKFALKEKATFQYMYDFGDDWVHTIKVEKITDLGPAVPVCSGGKRNCPPEDSGGPFEYEQLFKAHEGNKLNSDQKEWLGDYDFEFFDLDEINEVLSRPSILDPDYFSFDS